MATLQGTVISFVLMAGIIVVIVTILLPNKRFLLRPPLPTERRIKVINANLQSMEVCSQSERLTHLEEVCNKRNITPYHSTIPFYKDYSSFLVDEKHKLLYCILGKTGSTTLRHILSSSIVRHKRPYTAHEGMKWLEEYPVKERYEKVNSYYKMILVRHPVHRLISCWNNKFRWPRSKQFMWRGIEPSLNIFANNSKEIIKYQPRRQGGFIVSFNTFLKFVIFADKDPRVFDFHWNQYYQVCHPCEIKYDLIIKLETLSEDVKLLLKQISLDNTELPYLNQMTVNSREEEKIINGTNEELLKQVISAYSIDMDLFGYFWSPSEQTGKCQYATYSCC